MKVNSYIYFDLRSASLTPCDPAYHLWWQIFKLKIINKIFFLWICRTPQDVAWEDHPGGDLSGSLRRGGGTQRRGRRDVHQAALCPPQPDHRHRGGAGICHGAGPQAGGGAEGQGGEEVRRRRRRITTLLWSWNHFIYLHRGVQQKLPERLRLRTTKAWAAEKWQ